MFLYDRCQYNKIRWGLSRIADNKESLQELIANTARSVLREKGYGQI